MGKIATNQAPAEIQIVASNQYTTASNVQQYRQNFAKKF